jgi:hypothetical protein
MNWRNILVDGFQALKIVELELVMSVVGWATGQGK